MCSTPCITPLLHIFILKCERLKRMAFYPCDVHLIVFYSQTIILSSSNILPLFFSFLFYQRFEKKMKRFHAYLFRPSSQFHVHTSHYYSSQSAHTSSVTFSIDDCVFSTSPNIDFVLFMGNLLLCAVYTFNKYANV